jgi:ribonuclease-3
MYEEQSNDRAVSHDVDSADESSQPCPEQTISNEIDENRIEQLRELERRIGYIFNDIRLLDLSLTHKSFLGGNGEHSECNERMEFLGDTVLELVISSFLYDKFPVYTEGQLSKLKAVAVSRSTLALCAKEMGLGDFIKFGAGEMTTGGSEKPSNLSNALEALIASVYLDSTVDEARDFILSILEDKIYELDGDELKRDYKTALQEYWQAGSRKPPVYTVIAETGPDHDKRFEIEVKLAGEPYGSGIGRNKKEAEQRAAEKALETIFNRRREDDSEC